MPSAPIQGSPEKIQIQSRFLVEADGFSGASRWTEVSGLTITKGNIEFRQGGSPDPVNLDGNNSYGDVELMRGAVNANTELYDWMMQAVNGALEDVVKKTITIVPLDDAYQPQLHVYELVNCKPRELELGTFSASAEEVSMERLVVKPERILVVPRPA